MDQLLRALADLYRRLGFASCYPLRSSQPSVTPVSEDVALFSGLCRHQTCMWYSYMHEDRALIHAHNMLIGNKYIERIKKGDKGLILEELGQRS